MSVESQPEVLARSASKGRKSSAFALLESAVSKAFDPSAAAR
jgi:hypothetical protein